MRRMATPVLDPRGASSILGELLSRRPAYEPTWQPREGGPSWGLLRIFARMMEAVIQRLNQAPDKNKLAFLDMLGISLLRAQSARAPIVFETLAENPDGQAPAGTRLGGTPVGGGARGPIIFQTERSIGLASGQMVEAMSLWPGRDAYASHSADVAAGRPFTLFEPLQPVPHVLYLAHDTLLAFGGESDLEIELEFAPARREQHGGKDCPCAQCAPSGPDPPELRIAWEYWDGDVWRAFDGFERGQVARWSEVARAVVRLRAGCGSTGKTKVDGIEAYWVRARLTTPLPPLAGFEPPAVDRIWLRSIIERPLRTGVVGVQETDEGPVPVVGCVSDIQPDQAFAEGSQIDLTKAFQPLGPFPRAGASFYFSSEEVLSKPGAEVKVCFRKARTTEEEADEKGREYEVDVNNARERLLASTELAVDVVKAAAARVDAITTGPRLITTPPTITLMLDLAVDRLRDENLGQSLLERIQAVHAEASGVVDEIRNAHLRLARVVGDVPEDTYNTHLEADYAAILVQVEGALHVLEHLGELSPAAWPAAMDPDLIRLSPPRLVWEYWNGKEWRSLLGPVDDGPTNLAATSEGAVSFVVPKDIAPTTVNGVSARFIRVRLATGSYDYLRFIAWKDEEIEFWNFTPIIESRPPLLEAFYLGYVYRSPKETPEHCLTYSDFQYEDRTEEAQWAGKAFFPFQPVADSWPALYLGFDKPLPTNLVSLYFDRELTESGEPAPHLVWEAWDGLEWRELTVFDETANLGWPGMVSFIGQPRAFPLTSVPIIDAGEDRVQVFDENAAAKFKTGDRVFVERERSGELGTIREVEGKIIHLRGRLRETYTSGKLSIADLSRFGSPRSWVRARLRENTAPPSLRFRGVHLNATWASQQQTVANEMLGSSTGQPNEICFFSHIPVLAGERVEVRELEGRRAQVELAFFREQLIEKGLKEDDIRAVSDPRTGEVNEVWVRWEARPHLYFSGPDDRHYVVERARGRVIFGDGTHGRIPPGGSNNVLARVYHTGGGKAGNLPERRITQLLGLAHPAHSVYNVRSAHLGADGETVERAKKRGPCDVRHRWRSLSAIDYGAMAKEANPGVAVAHVLASTRPDGRHAPGWVTVVIIPQSDDSRPEPSWELRQEVQRYLAARAPAGLAAISVMGPRYFPVGVSVIVAPREIEKAAVVERQVRLALQRFLHPLKGGPEGEGWPFGRSVYASDVAVTLESVEAVDYVQELNLLLDDAPQGELVTVPTDRTAAAGSVHIRVVGAE